MDIKDQTLAQPDVRITLISVVCPIRGMDSIFKTLEAFLPQDGNISFQFIIVDVPDTGRAERLKKEFPWAERAEGKPGDSLTVLRNCALAQATGQYLVFVDDHIGFPRDYLLGIDRAAKKGFRIFGGLVENANPATVQSWTHYFCEYSKWLPTVVEGPMTDLPGSNFVVESGLLQSYLPFPDQGYGLETHLFKQCMRDGHELHFVHDFRIYHRHAERILVLWRYFSFNYGVWFGRTRDFGMVRRVFHAAAFPLTAAILYLRIFKNARKSPQLLRRFISCTPLLLLTVTIRAAGEAVGYLRGAP